MLLNSRSVGYGTWNSRGLRGSALEDLIRISNEQYREKGLALIQKVPTPITPINNDDVIKERFKQYLELASVSIASSMIILSQIVFVILLYFGINYLVTMILLKRSEKWVH